MDQNQEQAVRSRGYQLWQESGASHGHDREDWSRAEHEIEAAEDATKSVSVTLADRPHKGGLDALPCTPMALFFTLAQGWIESGRVLASMTPWAIWGAGVR